MTATADYQVAVVSYRRPTRCATKTLRMLADGGVDRNRIRVFVADRDEHDAYTATCGQLAAEIIIGRPGLVNQRNYVTQWYPEGQRLVCCDDDANGLWQLDPAATPDRARLRPMGDVAGWLGGTFTAAETRGASLWGIYPVRNPGFMAARTAHTGPVATGLLFCVGVIHGLINRHSEHLTQATKHDYERTLLRWEADGTVARFQDVTVAHRYSQNPGGLQATGGRTRQSEEQAVRYLIDRWPALVRRDPSRRASPFPQIALRRQPAPARPDQP